jgi:hypothetical protein
MPRVISRRLRQGLLLGAAVVFASSCQEELPTAPDDLAEGITVYEHAGFTGGSAHLTSDADNLSGYKGPCEHYSSSGSPYAGTYTYDWNDCISSIKVAPGWRATVYVDFGFHEDWLDVTADVPDLGQVRGYCDNDTWNDCISSIRVRRQ